METTSTILVFFLCLSPLLSESDGAPATPSPQTKALNFMRKFGYIDGSGDDSSAAQALLGNITEQNFKEAIKEVQRFGSLEETGELDEKTLELMSARRCGVADIVKDSITYPPEYEDSSEVDEHHHHHHDHHHHHHHSRRKRYILVNGWRKRHITYYLTNWSEHLTREEVQDVLEKALGIWGKHGNLRFTPVSYPGDADIEFGFYRRNHGDAYAFDGPGYVLAHAFSPSQGYQSQRGIDGDVHFDADEKWVVGSGRDNDGVDLMSAALHELGHSLGLSHSPDKDSVMYAYYTGGGKNDLGYDDILAMRKLYMSRRLEDDSEEEVYTPPRPKVPPPTRRTTTAPSRTSTRGYDKTTKRHWHGSWHGKKPLDGCHGAFDTVAFIRGELFIIKNKMLWRLTEPGQVQKGYPVEFRRMFALPGHVGMIDAIYERQTDSGIVIFSGSQFWVSDGNVLSSPRPLTDYGLPWRTTKVDAVTVRNGTTYIFSESNYWAYDEEMKTMKNFSRPMSDWGFPSVSFDSVMTYKDGNTYFFKGDRFWVYSSRLSHAKMAPEHASQYWLSC